MLETYIFWAALILAAVAIAVAKYARHVVTVFQHETGIHYFDGVLQGVLGPGRYVYWSKRHAVTKVDMRRRHLALGGQELLGGDGTSVKVSLIVDYQVADAKLAIGLAADYNSTAYLLIQAALREAIAPMTGEEVVQSRNEIGSRVLELAAPRLSEIGLQLNSVDLRDAMFAGDLKRAFAQVAIARKEGEAALERARGETAALRNLANAAKMLEGNPGLLKLRMLQSLSEAKGATIVLNASDDSLIMPAADGSGKK